MSAQMLAAATKEVQVSGLFHCFTSGFPPLAPCFSDIGTAHELVYTWTGVWEQYYLSSGLGLRLEQWCGTET